MFRTFGIAILFLTSCVISRDKPAKSKISKLNYLPVAISYIGLSIEDSIKIYITEYFQKNGITIISPEDALQLGLDEIKRAASHITNKEKFQEELSKNQRYICNKLSINFKLAKDSESVLLGWSCYPWPINFSRMIKPKEKYLQNSKIMSNAPALIVLKTLCDSIIYSNTLY